jgi:hypothetical protein
MVPSHLKLIALHGKGLEMSLELVRWEPGVQQGTEEHIPSNSRETVEIGDFHFRIPEEGLWGSLDGTRTSISMPPFFKVFYP